VAKLIGSLVGAAGTAACITLMSLSMRSVLDVGGTCVSGNSPYVIRQQCPTGVAWILPVAIWVGLGCLALFVWCAPAGGKKCATLAWTALFLALGWNFLQYGLPIQGHGAAWGWIVCGVLFVIMGVVPLFMWLPPMIATLRGVGEEHSGLASRFPARSATSGAFRFSPATAGPGPAFGPQSPPPRTPPPQVGPELTAELERLAVLHRNGDLSDAEYESAKRAVLPSQGWS